MPTCSNRILWIGLLLILSVPVSAQFEAPELGYRLNPVAPPVAAPAFTLTDMDEQVHHLSQYRGKVIMLNFWATWCPPCRREMPSMQAVYESLREQGLVVLAVNEWEHPDHVFAFMGELSGFPEFPILFDQAGDVAKAYAVTGLPSTFIIDKQGRIVYRAVGGRDFEHPEVVRLLSDLIAAPMP